MIAESKLIDPPEFWMPEISETQHTCDDCEAVIASWEATDTGRCRPCFEKEVESRLKGQPHAIFAFFQEQEKGREPFPCFDILGDHPRKGSSVCIETLKQEGIAVPPFPKFSEWKAEQTTGRK